ncbi:MAG: glycosyltransferase family 4 protein [Veillonellales bacterium]
MGFFSGQIQYLIDSGFDVAVICSPGWHNETAAQYYPLAMEREISLGKDFVSLIRLIKLLVTLKPDSVCAGTPKASFLAGIAAFVARVPVRVYMCLGLRLETTKGWKRNVLLITERVTSACATRIWCISQSVKNRLLELGLADPRKIDLLGYGSVNGIDLKKFQLYQTMGERDALLKKHSIPPNSFVIGFVGRLTKDKGVPEALLAFNELKQTFDNIFLVLVGSFEAGDPLPEQTLELIHRDQRVILTGFVTTVKDYYHLFDLLWLPSHREGMGDVLLEAAASGLAVVACRTTGIIDVVDDGKTGFLVPVGDSTLLAERTKLLLLDRALAIKMGQEARRSVEQRFNQQKVWEGMKNYQQGLLKQVYKRDYMH